MVKDFKKKYLNKSDDPYFISEIGINHNGKLKIALEMIKESKIAGFNAVKFQKRDANDMLNFGLNYTYTQTYDGAEQDNPNTSMINSQLTRVPRNVVNLITNIKYGTTFE